MSSSNSKVEQLLADFESTAPDKISALKKLRKLFFASSNSIEEEVKYGGITFNVDGQLVGGIFVYKEYVSIEFSKGASFSDEKELLEGKGKLRRHLKIAKDAEIKSKSVKSYIDQAVAN